MVLCWRLCRYLILKTIKPAKRPANLLTEKHRNHVQVFHRHAIVLKDFPGIGTIKGLGQTFGDAAKAPIASLASIARLQFVRIRDVQEEQFNELLRIARHIFVGSGAVHEGLCAESTFRMQEPEAENWEEKFSYFST
jgi:hypothetical protein